MRVGGWGVIIVRVTTELNGGDIKMSYHGVLHTTLARLAAIVCVIKQEQCPRLSMPTG